MACRVCVCLRLSAFVSVRSLGVSPTAPVAALFASTKMHIGQVNISNRNIENLPTQTGMIPPLSAIVATSTFRL